MVELTKLNKTPIVVNAELIEYLEATPDTMISLTTGKKIAVLEPVDEVVDKILKYRRFVNWGVSIKT